MPRGAVILRHRDIGRQHCRIVLAVRFPRPALLGLPRVGNEFHQRAVRIAEIHARARALGAETLHGPCFDGNATAFQVPQRVRDRPVPLEAEVAVAGSHRQPRHLGRRHAWSVYVKLPVAEAISEAHRARDQLCTQDAGVERIRALPVGDMDDAMIERHGQRHRLTPSGATAGGAHVPMSASSRCRACRRASCRAPRRARPWRGLFR
jgi:hypothetical protein